MLSPIKLLPLLLISSMFCSIPCFAGCGWMLGSPSSVSATVNAVLNINGTDLTPSANESSVFTSSTSVTAGYWGKSWNNSSKEANFYPTSVFTKADVNNPKGVLVDASVPGLYVIVEANMPQPASNWGSWSPAMPFYMTLNSSYNKSTATGGWGCSDITDTLKQTVSIPFTVKFYTTSDFDPTKAAGKSFFSTQTHVGVLENIDGFGGQVNIHFKGPISFKSAGCGTFTKVPTVNLGDINLRDIQSKPSGEYNLTPFQINFKNCYSKASITLNFASNQSTSDNLLINTNGTAKGVGIGLKYASSADATNYTRINLKNNVKLNEFFMNYEGDTGDATLNIFAFISSTDASALSSGTVNIPAVMVFSFP